MVDVRTETKHQSHDQKSKPVNPRDAIREARQRRLRVISQGKGETVKVYAANETMQAVLRHPSRGIRFRQELDQPVEWPNDSFTARRIAEGSVRTDGPGSGEMPEADGSLNPRQQAAALNVVRDRDERPRPAPPIAPPDGQRPEPAFRLVKLSPNTAVAGSEADIVMSCIGTGFTKDTVIKFGNYDEPTTFVSATEVTTGVKPSLFVNPDTVPVLVHTGGVSSSPLDFTFTETAGQSKSKPKHA